MSVYRGRTGNLDWEQEGVASGRPVLLIHPLGSDRRIWSPLMNALATRRMVVLDLPGHGSSSAAPGPYTIPDLGRDVIDLADGAGATEFDLCGMSLGGLISLWLAAEAPERVTMLAVSNTAARIGNEEIWAARIEAVEQGGMEAIREAAVARFFTSGADSGLEESAGRVLLATDPIGYAGCCAALRDADLRRSIEAIRCPTLVVGSDQDISTPPEESTWLHEHIPGSRLRILEGAAHLSIVERPEDWVAEVARFLSP